MMSGLYLSLNGRKSKLHMENGNKLYVENGNKTEMLRRTGANAVLSVILDVSSKVLSCRRYQINTNNKV